MRLPTLGRFGREGCGGDDDEEEESLGMNPYCLGDKAG